MSKPSAHPQVGQRAMHQKVTRNAALGEQGGQKIKARRDPFLRAVRFESCNLQAGYSLILCSGLIPASDAF